MHDNANWKLESLTAAQSGVQTATFIPGKGNTADVGGGLKARRVQVELEAGQQLPWKQGDHCDLGGLLGHQPAGTR